MVTASVTYLLGLEGNMSRTARFLVLLIRVQTKSRFTAGELAEEFGVIPNPFEHSREAISGIWLPMVPRGLSS